MVATLLTLVVAVQQPQVAASVDRSALGVGQTLVLTVDARAPGSDVVELLTQPAFPGFELVSTSQGAVFNVQNGRGVRTTTWRFTLRALSEGEITLGPVTVRIGGLPAASNTVAVSVTGTDPAVEARLAARLSRLVDMAPGPDGGDEVIVSVIASPDTIVLGDQIDLAVVAWFPRDVRSRLRNRPTLIPPELRGAWTYTRSAALSVVTSREVRGRTYDLFVHHQVVFPLTAGPFEVAPAMVTYNLPVRVSILSREVPQEVQSQAVTVTVHPPPAAGQPAGFTGTAARGIQFDVAVDTGGFATGDAATIVATLTGTGNVSLWPEPLFDWPTGLRVYQGAIDVQVDYASGAVGGAKIFRYLVVPDSVGSFTVPSPRFPYLDLAEDDFRVARAAPIRLAARVGAAPVEPAEVTRSLLPSLGATAAVALYRSAYPVGWLVVFLLPPSMAVLVALHRLIRRRRTRRVAPEPVSGLAALDMAFKRTIGDLIPDPASRAGPALVAALRAVGVEEPVADHTARLRSRLDEALYGPAGVPDPDELQAEIRQVLRTLPRRGAHRTAGIAMAVLLLAGTMGGVTAQAPSPEQLFEARAFGQAADSFAMRARAEPDEAAHWFNLGTSLEATGRFAEARAALTNAARLRPRNGAIREARRELPPVDDLTQDLTWVAWVTFEEAVAIAAVFWVLAWAALLFRRARWSFHAGWAAALIVLGYAAVVAQRYRRPVGMIVAPIVEMKEAPFGSAPAVRNLSAGTAVVVERTEGSWMLVVRGEQRGWLPARLVAEL